MKNITFSRTARRKARVSANIFGTQERPRISVYRSNQYISAQAIDDEKRITLVSCSSQQVAKKDLKLKKSEIAKLVGIELAKRMKAKKLGKGTFDRGAYTYLGRVKALAEGLREGGLNI